MEDTDLARSYAASRLAFGLATVLFPARIMRAFIGERAVSPQVALLGRLLGARDALLGVGALVALQEGQPVRRWMLYGAAADATDVVSTLAAWRHIPRRKRLLALLLGLAGAATGAYLSDRVD